MVPPDSLRPRSDRFLALLAAAVVPGTGRDRLLRLNGEEDAGGFPVQLNDGETGETVGHLRLFDEPLLDGLNVAVSLVRSPQSLAYLLEAAGAVALERCGAILDGRVSDEGGLVERPLSLWERRRRVVRRRHSLREASRRERQAGSRLSNRSEVQVHPSTTQVHPPTH